MQLISVHASKTRVGRKWRMLLTSMSRRGCLAQALQGTCSQVFQHVPVRPTSLLAPLAHLTSATNTARTAATDPHKVT